MKNMYDGSLQEFFLNNQTQWTVPNNVVAVRVWAIGGGGGGGGTKQGKNGPTSGSGGGGGALSASTFLVTPGDNYTNEHR
jgi:hypothetical protein